MSFISSISSALGLGPATRQLASSAPAAPTADPNIANVRVIGINDFHGQISDSTAKSGETELGGAATLSAYIQRERAGNPNGTVVVSAGDNFGAAPPESTLLRHHSSITVLDAMGLDLSTFGNHEFDDGYAEAIRLIYGDDAHAAALREQKGLPPLTAEQRKRRRAGGRADAATGARHVAAAKGKPKWPGSPFPWISANVVHKSSGKTVLPPYVIKEVDGVKVAFVGAVTADLKKTTLASGIENIEALDIADSINKYVPEIKAKGVKAIVVVMHEGGAHSKQEPKQLTGPIDDIAKRLDPEVDVIVAGHTREKFATTLHGKHVIHTGDYAQALGVVDLKVDRTTGQVVSGEARLVTNDQNGIAPDPTVGALVKRFEQAVAPRTQRVVATLDAPLTKTTNAAGESALGALIADAQRWKAKTQVALMNPGGIRKDLDQAGTLKWGTLFGVQPFANRVTSMKLTGAQLLAVLEEQFADPAKPKVLQVSGMTVHMDLTKPVGQRITKVVMADGKALDPAASYSVAANSFLADGGDGFTTFTKGTSRKDHGVDLDALSGYLATGAKVATTPPGRIVIDAGAFATT
jgi:2',3'-cyclic-nucleotide 2'-phosphodiesterase (5'-nucleotidase family)